MFLKKHSLLIVIYFSFLILFFPVLSTYFSQDDFFHFRAAITDGSIGQFLNFFLFEPFDMQGYAFYRPIFREVLYHINYGLFGLNPAPFRILQFVLQFINIYLVYKLIFRLINKKPAAYLAAFLYAISSTNIAVLYYLAGGIQAQGATMFVLLTLLLFQKHKVISFGCFLLALASHEMAIVAPALLLGLHWTQNKKLDKQTISGWFKMILPYALATGVFLYLDLVYIGVSKTEVQYAPAFNIKTTLNSLMWYIGWATGLPEMLIDFVPPGFKLDSRLMQYWGSYFRIIFPAFFSLSLIFLILMFKNIKDIANKKFLFLLIWFPVSLLPVLFLPVHKSTYYMAIAMPGFCGALSYLTLLSKRHIACLIIAAFALLNSTSVKLGETTYPAVQRGRIAKKLITDIKNQYPILPKGAQIYVLDDPEYPFIADQWGGSARQASFVLSNQNAFQLLYEDKTLEVYFEGAESNSVYDSELVDNKQVFPFVARIK